MHSGERQDNILSMNVKQLNPFELKTKLNKLLNEINSTNDLKNYLDDIDILNAQENKDFLSKILFKELVSSPKEKIPLVCFLLEQFTPKDKLIAGLWELMQNKTMNTDNRIMVLNMLRDLDADWSYEQCEEFLDDADEILDQNTKQLLNSAIINPEVQIDFMDFLASIKTEDKIALISSFENDFDSDALANILIPVAESNPNSPEGKTAIKILGNTKSQLALNLLNRMSRYTHGELNREVRKSLATLKMSGVRTDNTKNFYKKILSNTKLGKFYLTYPDGQGNMAMIFTRITDEDRVRFVSVVINLESGIKDCFGFYDISKFESSKIIERFLKDEKAVSVKGADFKNILFNAELKTISVDSDWVLPYEYICWRNLLIDIDCEEENIEDIVKNNVKPAKVDESIFSELKNMKISSRWFMDAHYSDGFEELIKELKTENDLNKLVNKHFDNIFNPEEIKSWQDKLIMSTYIKYIIGKPDEASCIYGLYCNKDLFKKFLKEILKRSIYEYLVLIKYNKDLNSEMFTSSNISDKLAYIETNWVK